MTINSIMLIIEAYATEVASQQIMPTRIERAMKLERIDRARDAVVAELEKTPESYLRVVREAVRAAGFADGGIESFEDVACELKWQVDELRQTLAGYRMQAHDDLLIIVKQNAEIAALKTTHTEQDVREIMDSAIRYAEVIAPGSLEATVRRILGVKAKP